jgi:hypothetical protein
MHSKQASSAFFKKRPMRAAAEQTFAKLGLRRFQQHGVGEQKFFASFFQKISACLP